MFIYIKNMVCVRCKMAVQSVFEELGIEFESIELGKVKLQDLPNSLMLAELNKKLKNFQLELMDDKRKIMVERIKVLILEIFQSPIIDINIKLSAYLSKDMDYEYTYLSNTFSELEGSTIERFYIVNRIEKVKELLYYEKYSISEIAFKLKFSSVSHLCLQFKKVTGYTPTVYRKLLESPDFVWRNA